MLRILGANDIISLMGGPGSGKGTQGQLLEASYRGSGRSVRRLVMSEIAADIVAEYRIAGVLAPDKIIIDRLRERIGTIRYEEVLILDGCSRTPAQYRAIYDIATALASCRFFNALIDTPDPVCLDRLSRRKNKDGERRPDDADPAAIQRRLNAFRANMPEIEKAIRDTHMPFASLYGARAPGDICGHLKTLIGQVPIMAEMFEPCGPNIVRSET